MKIKGWKKIGNAHIDQENSGASLVAQWLGPSTLMAGVQVQLLVESPHAKRRSKKKKNTLFAKLIATEDI